MRRLVIRPEGEEPIVDAAELLKLIKNGESDLVELKQSMSDGDKIREAICSFANDLPNHKRPGYVLIGVADKGQIVGVPDAKKALHTLADYKDSGNILPVPRMVTGQVELEGKSVVFAEVFPSDGTPVRFDGRVCIRIGPRRGYATPEEERRLTEKSLAGQHPFDRQPCVGSTVDDLLTDLFKSEYLPTVVSRNIIAENQRTIEEQLASLRLLDLRLKVPTHAGILILGKDPLQFLGGAYIQFVRFEGRTLADAIQDQKEIAANLITQLRQLDNLLPLQIRTARTPGNGLQHQEVPDYPLMAIRELALNAVMHRTYQGTNAPVRINWFTDRVEILSPGGLFGHVTRENFRTTSDYRNPVIAEAMKAMGYVEKFGTGIARAQAALKDNGNREAQFTFEETHVLVTIWSRE